MRHSANALFLASIVLVAAGARADSADSSDVTAVVRSAKILIPAGVYTIGMSAGKEACHGVCAEFGDLPVTRVKLAAYLIDRTEVSAAQYKACVDSGRCIAPDVGYRPSDVWKGCNWQALQGQPEGPPPGRENHPMNCVTWKQASTYCRAMGDRLPTEAEWEVAARGTDGRLYPWGNRFDPSRAVIRGARGTVPVDSMENGASPFGLLHMADNVSEWVDAVALDSDTGKPASCPGEDSPGHRSTLCHISRGGNWMEPATEANSVWRHGLYPSVGQAEQGFRCARDAPPELMQSAKTKSVPLNR